MEFHDLKPNYPPTPWSVDETKGLEGTSPKIELAVFDLRSNDKVYLTGSRVILVRADDKRRFFDLLKETPYMLELLVKLYKSDALSGMDKQYVEGLIEKHFTQKPSSK